MTSDKYDGLLRLADVFDATGAEMRARSGLGEQVLSDEAVAASADLAASTFGRFDDDVRAATTGGRGLLARSVELDADALMVRATVLTYRWIDELQEAAYRSLGSIAARKIGYLAPEVALGGAIVTAGLIETDALDRDGVAAYLDELVDEHPELRDHVTTTGGLLDGLQLRSWLTAGDVEPAAARGGLQALGAGAFEADFGSALRDVAGGVLERDVPVAAQADTGDRLSGLEELFATLTSAPAAVSVRQVAPSRFVAFLPGPLDRDGAGGARLVVGDHTSYADQAATAIAEVVGGESRVMLVGCGQGGATAIDIANRPGTGFVVDQVVTAGAPGALVPRVADGVRVLSLEDRTDPVALFGSLVNADADNRLTVVYDGGEATGPRAYVAGARAADAAEHPALRDELTRLRDLGYLS